jgi:hypothetical protein
VVVKNDRTFLATLPRIPDASRPLTFAGAFVAALALAFAFAFALALALALALAPVMVMVMVRCRSE